MPYARGDELSLATSLYSKLKLIFKVLRCCIGLRLCFVCGAQTVPAMKGRYKFRFLFLVGRFLMLLSVPLLGFVW